MSETTMKKPAFMPTLNRIKSNRIESVAESNRIDFVFIESPNSSIRVDDGPSSSSSIVFFLALFFFWGGGISAKTC